MNERVEPERAAPTFKAEVAKKKDKGKVALASPVAPSPGPLGLRYVFVPRGSGQPPALGLESNEPAWLYVTIGARALFTGQVAPNRQYLVEPPPGTVNVMLSRRPDSGDPRTRLMRNTVQQAQRPQRFDRQQQQQQQVAGDPGVYIVNTSPAPDARVVTEIDVR